MHEKGKVTTVGLVLSAGGFSGAAHHSGALDALFRVSGWDSRLSDVIVGTSAGSLTAISLRAGISPSDLASYYTGDPMTPEGQKIVDRVTTSLKMPEPDLRPDSKIPCKPTLLLRELFLGGRPRPMVAITGLLPIGEVDGSSFAERTSQIHPEPWPDKPTWLCSVDLDSGKRVVFGRDDIKTTVGPAVQASSAIPSRFSPVNINGKRYVDGGVHSATNSDLLAALQLDLVIISSSSTLSASQKNNSLSVAWNSRTLRKEIEQIRSNGTEVLVFEPTVSDLQARNELEPTKDAAKKIFDMSRTSAIARLAKPQSNKARVLLEEAILQI
jgi:NTE family protein